MNENSIPSKVKKVKIPFLAWDECDGDVTNNAIRDNCPLLESSFLLLLTRGAAFQAVAPVCVKRRDSRRVWSYYYNEKHAESRKKRAF